MPVVVKLRGAISTCTDRLAVDAGDRGACGKPSRRVERSPVRPPRVRVRGPQPFRHARPASPVDSTRPGPLRSRDRLAWPVSLGPADPRQPVESAGRVRSRCATETGRIATTAGGRISTWLDRRWRGVVGCLLGSDSNSHARRSRRRPLSLAREDARLRRRSPGLPHPRAAKGDRKDRRRTGSTAAARQASRGACAGDDLGDEALGSRPFRRGGKASASDGTRGGSRRLVE